MADSSAELLTSGGTSSDPSEPMRSHPLRLLQASDLVWALQMPEPFDPELELEQVSGTKELLTQLQQQLDESQRDDNRPSSLSSSHSISALKWEWVVMHLKQQQQKYPEKWDGQAAEALVALEQRLLQHNQRISDIRESSFTLIYGKRPSASEDQGPREVRLTIQDPIEPVDRRGESSWTNFSRLLRDASGRTVRTLSVLGTNHESEVSLHRSVSTGDRSTIIGPVDLRPALTRLSSSSAGAVPIRRSVSSLSFTQTMPTLLRSVASYLGLSMEETFLCQICYENVPVTQSFTLSNCGHSFCAACLQNFLEFKISEAQVYPSCFHETEGKHACSTEIATEDIKEVVSASSWEKYVKFKFNKENENARQCPVCDHSEVYPGGSDSPLCICENCGQEFCFVHSNAHRGHTCAEYEKKMVSIEKLNHAMINEISKPCPGCNNYVEKIGGCNQMKCVVCGTSFCWICREVIDDSTFPEHFQWWNVRGCAGNQMTEVEEQTTTQKVLLGIVRGLFFLIFGPPAFVLAVAFSMLCCCCMPCTKIFETTYRSAFTSCFCVSGYVLLSPLVLAAAILCSPCLCFGYWVAPEEFALDTGEGEPEAETTEQVKDFSSSPANETIFRHSA